jgi:hypothetical protein
MKKKMKRAGVSKLGNLVRLYSIDDSKSPSEWLEFFGIQFEAPNYQCRILEDHTVMVVNLNLVNPVALAEAGKMLETL